MILHVKFSEFGLKLQVQPVRATEHGRLLERQLKSTEIQLIRVTKFQPSYSFPMALICSLCFRRLKWLSSLVTDASLPSLGLFQGFLLLLANMSDVPQLLLASLNPSTRKQAEHNLATRSTLTSFLPSLLHIVLDSSQDRSVRLAGSVYLKNTIKSRWDDVSDRRFHFL